MFDPERPRLLLCASLTGAPLFEDLSVPCQRWFNVTHIMVFLFFFFFLATMRSTYPLRFVIEYARSAALLIWGRRRTGKRRRWRRRRRKRRNGDAKFHVRKSMQLRYAHRRRNTSVKSSPTDVDCRYIHSKYRHNDAHDRHNPSTFNIQSRGYQHATR